MTDDSQQRKKQNICSTFTALWGRVNSNKTPSTWNRLSPDTDIVSSRLEKQRTQQQQQQQNSQKINSTPPYCSWGLTQPSRRHNSPVIFGAATIAKTLREPHSSLSGPWLESYRGYFVDKHGPDVIVFLVQLDHRILQRLGWHWHKQRRGLFCQLPPLKVRIRAYLVEFFSSVKLKTWQRGEPRLPLTYWREKSKCPLVSRGENF